MLSVCGAVCGSFGQVLTLGVSLATIIPLPSGPLTVRAATALVSEFDRHFGNSAARVVSDFVRRFRVLSCGRCAVMRC